MWSDLAIDFPERIRNLTREMEGTYHLVAIMGECGHDCVLDATWDQGIEKAGFKINTPDDAMQKCVLAVNPCGSPIRHSSLRERKSFMAEKWRKTPKTMIARQAIFYECLNEWLRSVRLCHMRR